MSAAAIITFGAALVLSSNSVWQLQVHKRTASASGGEAPGRVLANEIALGSAGVQTLSGLAAIVLGILALAGSNAIVLTLAALLALGGALILTGSTLSTTVLSFMRPSGAVGSRTATPPPA